MNRGVIGGLCEFHLQAWRPTMADGLVEGNVDVVFECAHDTIGARRIDSRLQPLDVQVDQARCERLESWADVSD